MADTDKTNDSPPREDVGSVFHVENVSTDEADRLLDSLGVPVGEVSRQTLKSLGSDADRKLDVLITDAVAEQIWTEWNGEQRIKNDSFRRAFHAMLADGVRLGFRTERFRNISRSLPDPVGDGENWVAAFEGAIAGREKCRIALRLQPERYLAFMRTNTEGNEQSWGNSLSTMKDGLFYELGIVLPPITVAPDETLKDEEFRIEWNDVCWPKGTGLADDRILVNDTPQRLRLLNIEGAPATNPANGSECAIVDAARAEVCTRAGLTTWSPMTYTILALGAVLRRSAAAFVNRYLVWHFLNALGHAKVRPALINEVRKRFDVDVLVRTLRGLVDEDITIRDLSSLLEKMLSVQGKVCAGGSKYILFDFDSQYSIGLNEDDVSTHNLFTHNAFPAILSAHGDKTLTVTDYIRAVRASLRRYISHKYTRGQNTLIAYSIDPKIDARLKDPADLRPAERMELLKCVRRAMVGERAAQTPVITTFESRLRLRQEIRHDFPNLPVLSYQELSTDMNIQPIAHISSDLWP
jgi:type III secretory pathway component EscV